MTDPTGRSRHVSSYYCPDSGIAGWQPPAPDPLPPSKPIYRTPFCTAFLLRAVEGI